MSVSRTNQLAADSHAPWLSLFPLMSSVHGVRGPLSEGRPIGWRMGAMEQRRGIPLGSVESRSSGALQEMRLLSCMGLATWPDIQPKPKHMPLFLPLRALLALLLLASSSEWGGWEQMITCSGDSQEQNYGILGQPNGFFS